MFCPECGTEISDTSKFCIKCGYQIQNDPKGFDVLRSIICPNCGKEVEEGSIFCPHCKSVIESKPVQSSSIDTPEDKQSLGVKYKTCSNCGDKITGDSEYWSMSIY